MASSLVVAAVVRDGDVHVTDSYYASRRKRFAKSVGDGVFLRIRIEPKDEAVAYGQIKFYFGRIVGPLVEHTGYRQDEWHLMLKSQFLQEGKTSITELSHDEMRDYIEACEQWARETLPEAFALYDRGTN